MKAHVVERVVPVEIAGRPQYLNFSLKAASDLSKRFGGLDKIDKALDETNPEMIDHAIFMLYVMCREGAAYQKLVGDEEVEQFTEDQLGTLLSIDDINPLVNKMTLAMSTGSAREVEVKPDPKNAKAAQT